MPTYSGPLYEREYRLPLPSTFQWPDITHHAFHEDGGAVRESWRRRGHVSASIADRPTGMPPSDNFYHFIGQVYDYVQAIAEAGLVIVCGTSHVECGRASWSSWALWPENILNGAMKEAGEELLWMASLGHRHMAEQPHTAHEHTIGPPTFVTNANQHGGYDKTWCIWSRQAGEVLPSNVVPEADRKSILGSASGSREIKMLKRSRTAKGMADAITATMEACTIPVVEPGRPANLPCHEYPRWRASFHHNFGILAASFAPTLSADVLCDEGVDRHAPCAIIIPLAATADGARVMIPLRGAACFGMVMNATAPFKEQVEDASKFLSIGIESQHMHDTRNAQRDFIVAIPWDEPPITYASTPQQVREAAASGAPALWCSLAALADSKIHEAAAMAIQRMVAMGNPVHDDELNVGIWNAAKPAVLKRRAEAFGQSHDNPAATLQWSELLQREEDHKSIMQADLIAADSGNGLTSRAVVDVRTAADYAAELPIPPQGLPTFDDPMVLRVPAPQRPPPNHTDWLHRLPPQALPPGFTRMHWTEVLHGWARRMSVDTINRNAQYDAFCLQHGRAPMSYRFHACTRSRVGPRCSKEHPTR